MRHDLNETWKKQKDGTMKLIESVAVVVDDSPVIKMQREEAYRLEADVLFFKAQRGEIEMQVWLDKVKEIRERYPYSNDEAQA
jgi:hypothetical protein